MEEMDFNQMQQEHRNTTAEAEAEAELIQLMVKTMAQKV
jgi:hypothetical protein